MGRGTIRYIKMIEFFEKLLQFDFVAKFHELFWRCQKRIEGWIDDFDSPNL